MIRRRLTLFSNWPVTFTLADLIAHCLGHAGGFQSFAVRGRAEVLEMLEITPREVEGFILQTAAAVEEAHWIIPHPP